MQAITTFFILSQSVSAYYATPTSTTPYPGGTPSFAQPPLTAQPLCNAAKSACTSFDVKKYDGKWFQIGGSESVREEWGFDCKCTSFSYLSSADGNAKLTKQCTKGLFNNNVDTIVGNLQRKDSPSQFRVTYPKKHFRNFFHILGSRPNYEIKNVWADQYGNYQYALVVAPKTKKIPNFIENFNEKYWVLSRTPEMPETVLNEILRYATEAGFHTELSRFKKTEQVSCAAKAPVRK